MLPLGSFPSVDELLPLTLAALATNLAKVTLLLLLAGAATLALRRGSSATRHWIWSAALVGALTLPVLSAALPAIPLPVLPEKAKPVLRQLPSSGARVATASRRVVTGRDRAASPVAAAVSAKPLPAAPVAAVVSTPRPSREPAPLVGWPVLLLGAWITGAVLMLLRLVAGQATLLSLARRGRPLHTAAWTRLAERAAEQAGLDRPFELLESDEIGVPATFGVVRPTVVLPVSARDWPEERRVAVLVHELAHAARYDCLTQVVAQVACALYWFHPAVWWAEHRMRVEREQACDDRVITGRMRASDYADHLIQVLRETRAAGLPGFGAVAFARRSSLEGRLLALLDPLRDRTSPSPRLAWLSAASIGAFSIFLACAQMTVASAGSPGPLEVTLSGAIRSDGRAAALPPSEVLQAPDGNGSLEDRWAWALDGSRAGDRRGGVWVGYLLKTRAGGGHGLLSDSEGINLALLNGRAAGPSLLDVLKGRQGALDPEDLALLFHVAPSGKVDRVRSQSLSLYADLGGRPLYWLGRADDEQSLAWLRQLDRRMSGDAPRRALLDAASFHESAEAANDWLREVAKSDANNQLRAQAAEGLARHPTEASIELLGQLARADYSLEVRRSAIEALGDIDNHASTSTLFDIARSKHEILELRREAVEALGESATQERSEKVAELYEQAADMAAEAAGGDLEATGEETAEDQHDHSCSEAKEKEKEVAVENAEDGADAMDEMDENDDAEDSDEVQVQVVAVETLRNLPEDKALPRLERLARTHSCPQVRREAAETIGAFRSDRALALLEDLAWKAPDHDVQVEAVETIDQFPDEVAVRELERAANSHPEAAVRRQAVEMLGRHQPDAVMPILDQVIAEDRDLSVRAAAVESIGQMPSEVAVPKLTRIAKSKLPAQVRRQAIETLGRDDPAAALPALEEILGHQQTP